MRCTKKTCTCPEQKVDEELIDTLIAISVIAKRLATRLIIENEERK